MKVLIFGEYSGYGTALRDGFKSLGFESKVFSLGDGFKKINGDFTLKGTGKISKIGSLFALIPEFLKYDLIIVMNPEFFYLKRLGFITLPLFCLFKKKIILLACGDDVPFIKYGKLGEIPGWPYEDCELPSSSHRNSIVEKIITNIVAWASIKIIPAMHDYAIGWNKSMFKEKVTKVIPLACIDPYKNLDFNTLKDNDKIRILHGINRPDFKGTAKIIDAMNKIKEKYPEKIELIIPDRLNKDEYLKLLLSVDIIIDQSKSATYGMNAIYGLYANKIVFAPAMPYSMQSISSIKSPFISIYNDEIDIFCKLDECIKLWECRLIENKFESRNFAINVHSPKNICEQILAQLI